MNQKQRIDWDAKAADFNMPDKQTVLSVIYERERTINKTARALSERGRRISQEAVRAALHEIGHCIYLKAGYRSANWGKIKERQAAKKQGKVPSRYAERKKDKKDWTRKCVTCGKNCFPNYFYCPECHGVITRNRGYTEAYGDLMSISGRHRGA